MNSYKGMNQTNNPLFPTPSPFSNNGNNMDSDYWSSSSSSSITKQTPNCSTSGINSAFENKIVCIIFYYIVMNQLILF